MTERGKIVSAADAVRLIRTALRNLDFLAHNTMLDEAALERTPRRPKHHICAATSEEVIEIAALEARRDVRLAAFQTCLSRRT